MILCPVEDFRRYSALHPAFAAVADYLEQTDLDALPAGRTDPPGCGFHISASPQARTRPLSEAPLEAHRAYIDVQVVLEGADTLGWAPVAACRELAVPYDPGKDILFFRDAPQAMLRLGPGQLAVFFPEDAHAPLIGQGERLRKLVVKVPVL